MSDSKYLDSIERGTRLLLDSGYQLQSLASAFSRTGNADVAAELAEIALMVHDARKEIDAAVGREIHEQCTKAQGRIGETLVAMLDAANRSADNMIAASED